MKSKLVNIVNRVLRFNASPKHARGHIRHGESEPPLTTVIAKDIFHGFTDSSRTTRLVTGLQNEFPHPFTSFALAWNFLHHLIIPPSRKWVFASTGKNASTTVLRHLFQGEFGVPLTATYTSPVDINTGAVVHKLIEANVFARATEVLNNTINEIVLDESITRIAVVRNPYNRALSSFNYFCKSNEMGKDWFVRDRLRINAAVGFDWRTMPYTKDGLHRFLKFISLEIERTGAIGLDPHWRPQNLFIQNEIFRPTLLGRIEDFGRFLSELHRLGLIPYQAANHEVAENTNKAKNPEIIQCKTIKSLIESIYAQDFEAFNY